ncbi:hypothetical protein N7467_007258 [Penicillium canescens]|nr:hypothetical protein N7467_007258 [Penicillium canescens]
MRRHSLSPDCRQRKIKCDEQRPQCSQCLRAGRACRIIDGLFRPHSFSFSTPSGSSRSSRSSRLENTQTSPLRIQPLSHESTNHPGHTPQPIDFGGEYGSPTTSLVSPTQNSDPSVTRRISQTAVSLESPQGQQQTASIRSGSIVNQSFVSTPHFPGDQHTSNYYSSRIHDLPISLSDESPQDRSEITYFLRCVAEDSARWMDVCTGHSSYFSQHLVLLSDRSALVRYASVALAAKQLGQMKDPCSKTWNTPRQRHMATVLTEAIALDEPRLNFLWYGAKYYEKAIQLLFKQLSREDCSTCHLSPRDIYLSDLTVPSEDHNHLDEHENASCVFQILVACILCQYEDLSATKRAVTGHLDGIFKLIRPHLSPMTPFGTPVQVPQSTRALEASFWYFALNDVLDAHNSRKPCRLDAEDLQLWRRMGLPLNDTRHLVIDCISEWHQENVFLKSLIRLMCMFFNSDISNPTQWVHLDTQFDQWHTMLPPSFSATIDLPLTPSKTDTQSENPEGPFNREVWFGTDVCAIAMAFYHMIRILLLVNQPRDLFLSRYTARSSDLLASYNMLQRNLYQQAKCLIPIAQGRPSNTVRKHLVQPLYVAGRCLSDVGERKGLLELLLEIECDLGVSTKYRMRDLLEEWGMPLELLEKMQGDKE